MCVWREKGVGGCIGMCGRIGCVLGGGGRGCGWVYWDVWKDRVCVGVWGRGCGWVCWGGGGGGIGARVLAETNALI